MSWLDSYLQFTRRQESPTIFHWWNAVATIGATLNRKIYLRRISDGIERYRIYPGQIMVVLVAGSGRLRKSTSLKLPSSLLRDLKLNLLDGATSPEKLLTMLGGVGAHTKQGIITILASELAVFLSRQNYAAHLVTVLNDLADAPDRKEFSTIGRGDLWVANACVTLMAATTPIDLAEAIPPSALQRGFSSRIIFVYADKTDRKEALADKIDHQRIALANQQKAELVKQLVKISNLQGEVDYTDAGRAWFTAWYDQHYESMGDDQDSEGWPARRPDHLLRVAMILQVCKNQTLNLDVDCLTRADMALREVENSLVEVFARVGVNSGNSAGLDRIIASFKKAGGKMTNWEIYERNIRYYPDFSSLAKIMGYLKSLHWIQKVSFDPRSGTETWELVPPHLRNGAPRQNPLSQQHGYNADNARIKT